MSPKKKYDDYLTLPTSALDGEIWIQCQLRLTFQFQARHGIALHLCDPARRCLRIGLGEILDHRSGRAIYDAMLKLSLEDEFQDDFLEQLRDLDHLDSDGAGRLAFNLAMDHRWERIEKSALDYYESESAVDERFPAA
ncbi:MAG: hypothetical protein IT199_06010 [Solirubrobacterales bacterium]|nr:hypothetical protein [Solirubrobacterales bacterium]